MGVRLYFWSGAASILLLLYGVLTSRWSNLPSTAVMMSLLMASFLITIIWLAFVRPLSTRSAPSRGQAHWVARVARPPRAF